MTSALVPHLEINTSPQPNFVIISTEFSYELDLRHTWVSANCLRAFGQITELGRRFSWCGDKSFVSSNSVCEMWH